MAAALTFAVAIPANNTHWQVEIVKRGGGAWYFDKNDHLRWMWTVEPTSDARRTKRVIVPAPQADITSQRFESAAGDEY
jgi:hypothetical protein